MGEWDTETFGILFCMEKKLIIPIVVVSLLLVGSLVYFYSNKRPSVQIQSVNNGGVSSIREALSSSLNEGIKCTRIRSNKNVPPGTVYVKENKIKFEGGNTEMNTTYTASGIYTDEGLWVWDPEAEAGTKFLVPENQKQTIKDKLIRGFDTYGQECSPAPLDNSFFNPPSDISFKENSL